jgi:DnaK suppressor protein
MVRRNRFHEIEGLLLRRAGVLRRSLAADLTLLHRQNAADEVDLAVDAAQDELNTQLAEAESRELVQIGRALKRIREGSYGRCEECGKNIALARLKAVPYASLCLKCQRGLENEQFLDRGATDWSRVADPRSADVDITYYDIDVDSL